MRKCIARPGQTLESHLIGVSEKAKNFAAKIGLAEAGELIGLVHDLGKYSAEFQCYIQDAAGEKFDGNYDEDEETYDHKKHKGKIDHSTAGAQWIWQTFENFNPQAGHGRLIAQILAICVASHHSGLIDFTNQDGLVFIKRIEKIEEKAHFKECIEKCDHSIKHRIDQLDRKQFVNQFFTTTRFLWNAKDPNSIKAFYLGMLTKFLFSCLLDADRLDSAGRAPEIKINWHHLIDIIENKFQNFKIDKPIDENRQKISNRCLKNADKPQGIYRLTVPTGGGKTYASLRYALHHAKHHNLDRIIYIIPYTSIIEQNAKAIREILGDSENPEESKWVLEHHSNLEPETQTWHSKLACENWDKPIILTTMVQFLEVLFGSGTRGVRRLHQLTNSILIFDEIQSLPIKCFHLFCNALNFLSHYGKSTVVLCTATQPSLDALTNEQKGHLHVPVENELMGDSQSLNQLFDDLSRVEIENLWKPLAWEDNEITEFTVAQFHETKSVLVIVNTKASAKTLYEACQTQTKEGELFYLSTNLCAAHRKVVLDKIRNRLNQQLPVLCISTQLIEAGVDISFKTVIRYLAGLDSIAQASGRCNRHAEMGEEKGKVFVINAKSENLGSLEEMKIGQAVTARVFRELPDLKKHHGQDEISVLHPKVIHHYFKYYFQERADEMAYSLKGKERVSMGELLNAKPEYDTDMLELLSENESNGANDPCEQTLPWLRQAFMTAGRNFAAIDAPTKPLIVQYGKSEKIVNDLCAIAKDFDPQKYYQLLRQAQRYTVNVFPNDWNKLIKEKAVIEIQGEGIYFLKKEYYGDDFGVSTEIVAKMSPLMS